MENSYRKIRAGNTFYTGTLANSTISSGRTQQPTMAAPGGTLNCEDFAMFQVIFFNSVDSIDNRWPSVEWQANNSQLIPGLDAMLASLNYV